MVDKFLYFQHKKAKEEEIFFATYDFPEPLTPMITITLPANREMEGIQ